MHFSSLIALVGAASVVQASPLESANNTTRIALASPSNQLEGWAKIDLDDMAKAGITKRRAETYCANQNSAPGSCAPLDTVLAGTLATLLKRNADSNTCTGTSGSQNGVSYTFYTAPDGNCKTTAEQGTIEGGLNRYFSYLGNQVCGIHCVRLDHGGTYNAFITLGPEGSDLGSVSCSAADTYVDCGNGGQNDS